MIVTGHLVLIFFTLIINIAQQSPNTDTRFFSWGPEYMETDFDSLEDRITDEKKQEFHDFLVKEMEENRKISGNDYDNSRNDKSLLSSIEEKKQENYKNSPEQMVQKEKLLKESLIWQSI